MATSGGASAWGGFVSPPPSGASAWGGFVSPPPSAEGGWRSGGFTVRSSMRTIWELPRGRKHDQLNKVRYGQEMAGNKGRKQQEASKHGPH